MVVRPTSLQAVSIVACISQQKRQPYRSGPMGGTFAPMRIAGRQMY